MASTEMDETRLNLTRRFDSPGDALAEVETNLMAGTLWVPVADGERPPPLAAVSVTLVLPDGSALDGLAGRILCVAPGGVAVALDGPPPAPVMLRLRRATSPPLAPPAPPAGAVSKAGAGTLAPEDAPPLPDGIIEAWEAIEPRASFPAAKDRSPELVSEPPPPPVVATAPSFPTPPGEPAAVRSPLAPTDGVAGAPSASGQALDGGEATAMPAAETAPPPEDAADFPAVQPVPVPAVPADAGMWGDEEAGLGLPAAKVDAIADPDGPGPEAEPEEPPRPAFTVRFANGAELEAAWRSELGAERVRVPVTGEPPPLDAVVEVTLLLPDFGALVLEGTVVHRTADGAGVKLRIDAATRSLIESALPSNGPPAPPAPPPPAPEPPAPQGALDLPAPATEARPSLLLRTGTGGKVEVVASFETLADFRREYERNIQKGGVMVPTAARPPVRSKIEVVFSLLGGKREVRLLGEVVLHTPSGIGVQLGEIPRGTRIEIDALLAAASTPAPVTAATPSPTPPAPPVGIPPPAPAAAGGPAGGRRALEMPSPFSSSGAPVTTTPAGGTAPRASLPPMERPVAGELVEVMREAEVEGVAGVGGGLADRASWLKVLAHLQSSRASGILRAVRKAETKTFLLHDGRILAAKGDPPRDDESMLRVIRRHNLAKPAIQRILEKALDREPDEVVALQSANVWSAQDIDRARRWQVLDRCAEVFAWSKGRFEFDPGGDRSWARPTPGVPAGHVILHGVRTYLRASGEDLARVLRTAFERVVSIVPKTGFEPTRVGMSDKELEFWADIDGKKTLRQLLSTTPIAISQAHRLVFALCRLGVLCLEKAASAQAKPGAGGDAAALRARVADVRSRDMFGRLGLSWMCVPSQVRESLDLLKAELATELKTGGAVAEAARELIALGEEACRQLSDDHTRRLLRLKLIEDPARIEAAADMLAERADLLRMQGDRAGAELAARMAIDLMPGNPAFARLLEAVGARG